MKKFLKWFLPLIAVLLLAGFTAFLWLIPPFSIAPPEAFIDPELEAAPPVPDTLDPATRLIAGRGRYLVTSHGCAGCHTPGGDKGPIWTEYLAGGLKFSMKGVGTVVSRNLTPDPETGLARRSEAQVMRVLTSGVSPDGDRVFYPTFMPWADFSNWSEEDRYAVIVYLRHLNPVWHRIPDRDPESGTDEETISALDHGIHR
jgi:mono/diheme cytochrome c family protein